MKYTRTAENMAVSMYRLGYSPAYIRKEAMKRLNADAKFRKEVAKNTLEYKKEIAKLIQKIENDAAKAGDKILAGAGDMSWYSDLAVWKQAGKELNTSRSKLNLLVEGIAAQTGNELKNLTRSMGFKTKSGFTSVENLYRNELDKAIIKIVTGTFSQDQVVQETIRNLAKSGLRTVAYGNRAEQLDVAVSRAVRTGAHQITGQIQNQNMMSSGENLVYVAEHAGARNTGTGIANHEEWQGKVYYIKPGKDYSEEAKRIGQQDIKDLWECTGYSVDGAHPNNPLGLFGYNCRHLYHPWWEGISEFPKKAQPKPDKMWEGKRLDFYAQTQQARAYERNIRNLKREREAYLNTGQDDTEIKKKLSEAERKYKLFCEKMEMPVRTSHTRYESGTADITKTKAYQEYQKEVKITNDSVISITNNSNYENNYILPIKDNNDILIRESLNRTSGTEIIETIKAKRLMGLENEIYISDSTQIKPRKLHEINTILTKAYKLLGINDSKPICVILGSDQLGKIGGRYDPMSNTIFVKQIRNKKQKHLIIHELIHFKDSLAYKNKIGTIYNNDDLINYNCKKMRAKLDKLGVDEYNVNKISSYAETMYKLGRYDEAYTELRTLEYLERWR